MRIALITDGIWPYVLGGMQKHSYFLCRYLARNKVHVDLYHYNQSSYDIHKLEFFTEQEKEFIHPVIVDMPPARSFPGQYIYRSYLHSKLIYERLLLSIDSVDFIYTKGFTGWYLINRKFRGKIKCAPVGVNFHGYEMFQRAPDRKSIFQQVLLLRNPVRMISQRADYVFSYGGKITQIIRDLKIPSSRIIEMPAGVEENSWVTNSQPAGTALKFVFLGRYERRKGIEEFNKAISILISDSSSNPKAFGFEVHFIGPVPENKRVNFSQVIYHGEIRDKGILTEKLRSCDILVCPSWSEGMPNVILEAMTNGLAVIATDVGATSLLVNEATGWLMPDPEPLALVKTMKKILAQDKKTIEQKKRAALLHVQEFTWEKNIQILLHLLLSSKN